MDKTKFLNEFAKVMELDVVKVLTGAEQLADIKEWDSLAVLGFIAMVDRHMSKTLNVDKITQCKTVDDLWTLIGEQDGE